MFTVGSLKLGHNDESLIKQGYLIDLYAVKWFS